MTAPGAPTSGDTTAESTPEAPSYTSPTEQFQEAMARLGLNPAWGFKHLFEKLGKSGGGGGGRFEFSLEEMGQLHRQFTDEVEAIKLMQEKSRLASGQLEPLAKDDASMKHFVKAQEHYGKVREAVAQHLKFAQGFRDAIGASIGIKAEGEDAVRTDMDRHRSAAE